MKKLKLSIPCRLCGEVHTFEVNEEKYREWLKGKGLIQNMLPDLTPEQRELLLTGLCNDCFKQATTPPIEDEEEW